MMPCFIQQTTRVHCGTAALVRITCRMPVIVEPPDWPLWFGETEGDAAALLRPAADGVLRVWPVSRAVNTPRNNGPALLAPVGAGG